ncbi:DotU family type IV/VI secretion system protein [Polyangium spumosum]|uniref:DotU family type IV/VI secretion system protein n=1 Tax=Polyangium spumosum TaxID=889282 RepID=A0A6N7PUZ6_9BACT|nr:DotU family type IV/VI secretion system protein [Polyangium spumosum]
MERSIGVYGEELLLWICAVRQSPRRPPAEHLLQTANSLMNELKSSKASEALPVVSADDGQFAIAAIIDEIAMSLPDLRPLWSQYSLQATRWYTTNAGVEFYQRLERVKEGPKSVLATYYVVLGLGFMGKFGLPGQVQYGATQTRIDVARALGVDADRDWHAGALRPVREETVRPIDHQTPWWKSLWMSRGIGIFFVVVGLVLVLVSLLGGK